MPGRWSRAGQVRRSSSARNIPILSCCSPPRPILINPPTGCRFHPRCPYAMPVCRERFPERTDVGNGHWTHCFYYGDGGSNTEQPPLLNLAVPPTPRRKAGRTQEQPDYPEMKENE